MTKEKIKKHFISTLKQMIELRAKEEKVDDFINKEFDFDDFKCNLFLNMHYNYEEMICKSLSMYFKMDDVVLDWIDYLLYENSYTHPGKCYFDHREYRITTPEELWQMLEAEYELIGE